MAKKTYYVTFREIAHELARYLAEHQSAMVNDLGILGTQYATDLQTLSTTLSTIETTWPAYREPV